jgi:hypothetical protein
MSDVRFWVTRYLDEGWSPIPIPPGEKHRAPTTGR